MPASDGDGRARVPYVTFMVLLGLLGWALLLTASYVPSFGPTPRPPTGVLPFALFLVVIVAARGMAFRLLPQSVVSLDSALYVAAAVCLGSVKAGMLVALALTLDSLFRLLGAGASRRAIYAERQSESLSYVLYFGGMTGALLTLCGWLFRVDRLVVIGTDNELQILAKVFAVGATLLVAHYAIQAVRYRMLGEPLRVYLRNMALPGILSELSLLPLAVVVVFIYHPDRPLGFVLLGATFLLINFVFNRLSRAGTQLRQRVAELETLNATAHRLTVSLQIHELVDAVARETVAAIDEVELLTLAHRRMHADEGEQLVLDTYDRDRDVFECFALDSFAGPTGWVIEHGRSLLIGDLDASELQVVHRDESFRAWLGVPLVIYGDIEGVLAVQSRRPFAFGPDHRKLLEAIGAQVAVALQNAHLYELAMVDGLTGLFVRRYFDARLDEEIQRSNRFGTVFSCVMMDLDNFKALNDTHGHPVGDQALRAVARVVREQMRGVDTAARYGGEEMSLILPRTDIVSAYNLAERIRALIDEIRIEVEGDEIGITASFGISAHPESGATDAADLVRLADRALYRAKKTGKNRVELFWSEEADQSGRPSMRTV